MPTTTTTFLKYAVIAGLVLVLFIPLYVANPLFFPFITGKAFAFRILVEVIFALWLVLVLREKSAAPRINSLTIVVTAFTLIVLVADLLGVNPLRSIWSNFERMEGWLTIIHLWAYFIVLSSVLNSRENWNRFLNVILISGTITAFYGLFQFFGWAATHQGSTRVDASLGNSAYMAVYMLINAFLAGYMVIGAYASKKKLLVWTYSVLGILFSFIMFQTVTRGTILGWIGAILIACAIYGLFGRKEKGQSNVSRMIAGGIIVIVVIMSILFYFNRNAQWIQKNEVLGRLATISISDVKTQARGYIWPVALKGSFSTTKTAIIGWGQENFNYIFNANYNPKMWSQEQWFDRAHSVFLDWLVAGGLLGLLAYLCLYLIALVYIAKSDLSIGQKSMLIGLLVGYGIHNVFVFDNQTSYVMFFTFLAFVHSFKSGKVPALLNDTKKPISEDYLTVRDYIFVPLIVLVFGSCFYFINVRPIQANTRLITSLKACSDGKNLSADLFKKALSLNQTVANQEIREQLFSCSTNVIRSSNVPNQAKSDFYTLVKIETDKQIAATPKDARIYILAGGFYDAVRDWETARPLLEKALELSPRKQTIIFELAVNYLNSNKNKEALALLEQAYFSAPENDTAKIGYVVALITAGEEKKAHEMFADSPELFSDTRVINAYISIKQYTKAIEIYKELLKKSPESQDLYSGLVSAYLLNKQDYLAIQTLKTAEDKIPLLKSQIEALIKQIQEGKVQLQ